jgi:hypothetical protein
MTLCIAWKNRKRDRIYLCSDSRLTGKENNRIIKISDSAPKIYSIPIRIYDNSGTIVYDKDWGFCFAGGYINGSSYSDTLSEILSNLEIVKDVSNYEYSNIIDIAFNVYKQISEEYVMSGKSEGLTKVLIAGICPTRNDSFLFEFGFSKESIGFSYYKNEIDINKNSVHLIGDEVAINEFNSQEALNSNYYKILDNICNDTNFETVGGRLQSGYIDKSEIRNFVLCGVLYYELEKNDYDFWTVKDIWNFRSIEIKPWLLEGDIHVKKWFLYPFENKRNELFNEANKNNEDEINK